MTDSPLAEPGTADSGASDLGRIWTIPNLLSISRFFGVPLFLWLLLGPHADGWALAVLIVSGFTDWADGVLARKLNQMSQLGALLDPLVDRLYILATLLGLVLRHVIPLWLALVIIGRDLVLLCTLPALNRRGMTGLPVHYLGKAATFNLLYAFPLLLIGSHPGHLGDIAKPIAWAFTIWGTGLYLWAGGLYLIQVRRVTAHVGALMPATRRSTDLSGAMLNDLLNNTLDPGYRAAAARNASQNRPRRWWDGPMVWLGCLAVGLLLVVAYQQNHLSAPARDDARAELINRIHSAQQAADRMDARAKQLASQVAGLRDAELPGSSGQLKDAEIAAGSIPVSGPGMQIELDEPASRPSAGSGRPGTTPQSQVAYLHDKDIRAVVNELWAGGAEAIAVNGLRLTPTSFIRVAGESIQIDFQPINPPYTISAIGDRDGLQVSFAQSAIARQFKTMVAVDGIAFRFGGKSTLKLPSVTVDQPRYASRGPAPSSTPTPTSTESR